jgi:hypothetical protein
MVTLADFSDTASLMTCKHCGQLLQEGDRFCRFCGQDQQDESMDAGGAMPPFIDVTQPPANGDPALAPADARAARRAARLRERLRTGDDDAPERGPGGAVVPGRWAVSIAAVVLVVLAVALLHDLYRSRQDESTRRAELTTALAQVEEALGRGDLSEVQLKLAILDAMNPNDADVKVKREAFERRVQELTAERDQLRAAVGQEQGPPTTVAPEVPAIARQTPATATTTATPPGVDAPTPASAPAPAPAAVPAPTSASASAPGPSAPTVPAPAPAPAAPAPEPTPAAAAPAGQKACPEALAAMALCPSR